MTEAERLAKREKSGKFVYAVLFSMYNLTTLCSTLPATPSAEGLFVSRPST